MGHIFISFADRDIDDPESRDAVVAKFVADWLVRNSYAPLLFSRPSQGLPDQQWRVNLDTALLDADAVFVIQSRHWVESTICQQEFKRARDADKPIFVISHHQLQAAASTPPEISKYQRYDLSRSEGQILVEVRHNDQMRKLPVSQETLQELLFRLGDAVQTIPMPPWPDNRSGMQVIADPYKYQREIHHPTAGLDPFHEWQGGVFFGRDQDIIAFLQRLRAARSDRRDNRAIAVVGPSGVGKSSFLRAGIVSRLIDMAGFVTFPVIRPSRGVESRGSEDLYALLSRWVAQASSPNTSVPSAKALLEMDERTRAETFCKIADAIHRIRYNRPADAIVLPIDQAEELFFFDRQATTTVTETAKNGAAVLDFLKSLHRYDDRIVSVYAIRADYENDFFQSQIVQGKLAGRPVYLEPISNGDYTSLIKGPLEKLPNVTVENAVVTQLAIQAREYRGGGDVLPLLSIIIEDLWRIVERKNGAGYKVTTKDIDGAGLRDAIKRVVANSVKALDDGGGTESDLVDFLLGYFVYFDEGAEEARRDIVNVKNLPTNKRDWVSALADARLLRVVGRSENDPRVVGRGENDPRATSQPDDILAAEIIHDLILSEWLALKDAIQERARLLAAKKRFVSLAARPESSLRLLGLNDLGLAREYKDDARLWHSLDERTRLFLEREIVAAQAEREAAEHRLAALQQSTAEAEQEVSKLSKKLEASQRKRKTLMVWSGVFSVVLGLASIGAILGAVYLLNQDQEGTKQRAYQATYDGLVSYVGGGAEDAASKVADFFKSGDVVDAHKQRVLQLLLLQPEVASRGQQECTQLVRPGQVLTSQQARFAGRRIVANCAEGFFLSPELDKLPRGNTFDFQQLQSVGPAIKQFVVSGENVVASDAGSSGQVFQITSGIADLPAERVPVFKHRNTPVVSLEADRDNPNFFISTSADNQFVRYNVSELSAEGGVQADVVGLAAGGRPKWARLFNGGNIVLAASDPDRISYWRVVDDPGNKVEKPVLTGEVSFAEYFSAGPASRLVVATKAGGLRLIDINTDESWPVRYEAPVSAVGYADSQQLYFSADAAGYYQLFGKSGELIGPPVRLSTVPTGLFVKAPNADIWAGIDAAGQGFVVELGRPTADLERGAMSLLSYVKAPSGQRFLDVASTPSGFLWLSISRDRPDGGILSVFRSDVLSSLEEIGSVSCRRFPELRDTSVCQKQPAPAATVSPT